MARKGDGNDETNIHLPHDKVRVREGTYAGQRGIIRDVQADGIVIILAVDESTILLHPGSLQNYSLAARKAWKTNSKRDGIGGRKPSGKRPRMPVAFRVDPLVWDLLKEAGNRGLIVNRTDAINEWILNGVTNLLRDVPAPKVDDRDNDCHLTLVNFTGKGR